MLCDMSRDLLNDLVYGEQIRTDGCTINFAVGLTYSLDLEALLTVPLTIGNLEELDRDIKVSPTSILRGIHEASGKMVIFCNKGSIDAPKQKYTVFPLLENSIFEVSKGAKDEEMLSNFHPKLWLVHETDKQGVDWLKLSVMSRNLTFSTCLDICCSMRGRIYKSRSRKGTEKHAPLRDMLLWLSHNYIQHDKKKQTKVEEVANLLDYVEKFDLDEPFQSNGDDGYSFYPFVFNEKVFSYYAESIKSLLIGKRILVVSPFIDIKTLQWLTMKNKKDRNRTNSILITRKEYVTQDVFNLFEEVWVPNDTMLDNTTAELNLHAKMYLVQCGGDDSGYTLYLGSANATNNAFHRNVEFLLRLHYAQTTKDRIDELKKEITGDHRFIQLDGPNPQASNKHEYDNAERKLKYALHCLKKATITPSEKEGLYNATLHFSDSFDKEIKVRPLQCEGYWQTIDCNVRFTDLYLESLSEFYVLSIQKKEMVTKVHTIGMPKERDSSIYQSIVTTKEGLVDFIAFMLSDTPTEFIFEQSILRKSERNNGRTQRNLVTMPIYEQLLKKASTDPKQIEEVIDFVSKMKPEVVTPELLQILSTFQKVKKHLK